MAINVSFSISDAKGDISTVTVQVPESTSYEDAVLFGQQMAGLIEPLVNGTLRSVTVTIPVAFTPWSLADAASDIQEKAAFGFRTVNNFIKRLSIPTILESIFNLGSKDVDTTDPDVAAFVTAMESGIDLTGAGGTGTVAPVDTRDEDLVALDYAREAWGRSRG